MREFNEQIKWILPTNEKYKNPSNCMHSPNPSDSLKNREHYLLSLFFKMGSLCVTRVQVAVCAVSSHIICRSTMSQFHISARESPGIIVLDSASVHHLVLAFSQLHCCFWRALCFVIINSLLLIYQLEKKKADKYVLIWALFHRRENMTKRSEASTVVSYVYDFFTLSVRLKKNHLDLQNKHVATEVRK